MEGGDYLEICWLNVYNDSTYFIFSDKLFERYFAKQIICLNGKMLLSQPTCILKFSLFLLPRASED
jgi:hypothetical protein